MADFYMAAGKAQGKSFVDPVFSVLGAAREAIAEYGSEEVVNASIGTIYDDEEKLATFDLVMDLIRKMPPEDMMDYAPIKGVAGFEEAALEFTFGASRPESYVAAIATPGGTGAIRNIFYNYGEPGKKILIPDWFWGSYTVIAKEANQEVDTYKLFTEDNSFNLPSLQKKVEETLANQDHLIVVFNTPAHNPTGFSLGEKDWQEVLDFFRSVAKDGEKRITLLLDVAYMDFAGGREEVRRFFAGFKDLPQNLLVTVAFSMSKSFLAYGLRCGALIGITSNQRVLEEFLAVNTYSSRGTWSNVNRLPQNLLVEIVNNSALMEEMEKGRHDFRGLLAQRGAIFVKEAEIEGLEICPYFAGFFISLPMKDAQTVANRLQQERIFAVPLKKGLRIAVCSVPTKKMDGLASCIKQVL